MDVAAVGLVAGRQQTIAIWHLTRLVQTSGEVELMKTYLLGSDGR
jgi:hypothetical protein